MPGPLTTIDAYIAAFPPEQQAILQRVRATIRAAAPLAEERMAYNMPAFWQRKILVYFAGTRDHLGLYPTGEGVAAFAERLTAYSTSAGTIRFPWTSPIPYDLIADITTHRLAVTSGFWDGRAGMNRPV